MDAIEAWSLAARTANADLIASGTDLRKPPWKGASNPDAGSCYVLSEVLAAILRYVGYEVEVYNVKVGETQHWFLRVGGRIVDPTASQFGPYGRVPYQDAVRRGFLTGWKPSKRAMTVLKKMGLDKESLGL